MKMMMAGEDPRSGAAAMELIRAVRVEEKKELKWLVFEKGMMGLEFHHLALDSWFLARRERFLHRTGHGVMYRCDRYSYQGTYTHFGLMSTPERHAADLLSSLWVV